MASFRRRVHITPYANPISEGERKVKSNIYKTRYKCPWYKHFQAQCGVTPYLSWTRDVTNMISKLDSYYGGGKLGYYVLKGVYDAQ